MALARAKETTELEILDLELKSGFEPAAENLLNHYSGRPLAQELRRLVTAILAGESVLVPSEGCSGRADASAASRSRNH